MWYQENSEWKNVFWFCFKGHLAVGSSSQYILQSLFSSGSLNDVKATIPLLKGLHERLSLKSIRYQKVGTGYDYEPIYQQVHRMGQQPIITYHRRNEPLGFDKHFAPTSFREHSYRYDSYYSKYKTLKYTRPKECCDCPLAQEGIWQKVFKMKTAKNLRKYTAPDRGSRVWKILFKKRTAVERVNGYLKEYFQLNNIRYRQQNAQKFILI